ncbi:MAG: 2-amino-4-hydroxy-6-hydroxymethyldihydropteridine diphosphokinase [Pseudomonadota bacterium]|nr:2-amino-4-hydroxy-6-hydroxymethyldihydropteridine diphosphokinase [Pseudomonadota bacterium]
MSGTAYVGIGSNLDDPLAQCEAGLAALQGLALEPVAGSPWYGSTPLGPAGQPDYVNGVARLRTALAPAALLAALQRIETERGRRRDGPRWGPRRLDLDLLLHGAHQCAGPTLTLPHPGLTHRNFVLVPLLDLAPDLRLPDGTPLRVIAGRLGRQGLWRLRSPGAAGTGVLPPLAGPVRVR